MIWVYMYTSRMYIGEGNGSQQSTYGYTSRMYIGVYMYTSILVEC